MDRNQGSGSRKRGEHQTSAVENLAAFLQCCSYVERLLPLRPWLAQLPESAVLQLTNDMAIFVQSGKIREDLVPLVKLLVHCERPDLADDACVLNDELLSGALWNPNSAICFRRGDLPAYDDEVTYDVVSVLDAMEGAAARAVA